MANRTNAARMYPDHDWLESDFESLEMRLDEGPVRRISEAERLQRTFERHYAKYLVLPEVRAMNPVIALRTFLDRFPHYCLAKQEDRTDPLSSEREG